MKHTRNLTIDLSAIGNPNKSKNNTPRETKRETPKESYLALKKFEEEFIGGAKRFDEKQRSKNNSTLNPQISSRIDNQKIETCKEDLKKPNTPRVTIDLSSFLNSKKTDKAIDQVQPKSERNSIKESEKVSALEKGQISNRQSFSRNNFTTSELFSFESNNLRPAKNRLIKPGVADFTAELSAKIEEKVGKNTPKIVQIDLSKPKQIEQKEGEVVKKKITLRNLNKETRLVESIYGDSVKKLEESFVLSEENNLEDAFVNIKLNQSNNNYCDSEYFDGLRAVTHNSEKNDDESELVYTFSDDKTPLPNSNISTPSFQNLNNFEKQYSRDS